MTELMSATDHAKRAKAIRTTLEAISNLQIQRESINSQIKAHYDDLEAKQQLNRKGVKHAVAMLKMEEEKRFSYEKTKAIIYDAHGWHFQPDLFAGEAYADADTPDNVARPFGIGADNLDLLGDVDTSDDPGEDDEGDFMRAEIDEQERIAAAR